MEVSYGKGLATHTGPKSCVGAREGTGEALTGVRVGPVSSRAINRPPKGGLLRGADALENVGRPHPRRRHGKAPRDPARSETRRMHASTWCENREIPRASAADEAADRIGKSKDARR